MKLKKLQRVVIKELQECGVTEDKDGLHATLMDKVIVMKESYSLRFGK
jgi:cell growth-regulating nucleolar protein